MTVCPEGKEEWFGVEEGGRCILITDYSKPFENEYPCGLGHLCD